MPLVQVAGLATLCEEAAFLLASFAEPHAAHLKHEAEAQGDRRNFKEVLHYGKSGSHHHA